MLVSSVQDNRVPMVTFTTSGFLQRVQRTEYQKRTQLVFSHPQPAVPARTGNVYKTCLVVDIMSALRSRLGKQGGECTSTTDYNDQRVRSTLSVVQLLQHMKTHDESVKCLNVTMLVTTVHEHP